MPVVEVSAARSPKLFLPFTVLRIPMTPEQKKANRRLALILASIAFAVFVGFVLKMVHLGPGR